MASQFPDTVSMQDVLGLAGLLRSNPAPTLVVKEVSWLVGCAINAFDGEEPRIAVGAAEEVAEASPEAVADKLTAIVDDGLKVSANQTSKGVPAWLQSLYPLLLALLQQYLSK